MLRLPATQTSQPNLNLPHSHSRKPALFTGKLAPPPAQLPPANLVRTGFGTGLGAAEAKGAGLAAGGAGDYGGGTEEGRMDRCFQE